MALYLGNLSVNEIEKRIGINFPEDIREFMNSTREMSAQKTPAGKWHCFDIPFMLVCGDIETAKKIYNSVKDQSEKIKEPLQIGLS